MKRCPHKLAAAVRTCLEKHLQHGEGIAVALSGGMDSVSLLECALLHTATFPLSACHVNHGISPRAAAWEKFCVELCAQRNIPCYIHVAVPPQNASEQWAREVRLGVFADLPVRAILAAHHQEDQAETVLFRALRGTSAHGMAAMRQCAPLPGYPDKLILRPWLSTPKNDIIAYAKTRRLQWVEDEDNRNTARRRNFLRCRVMPVLRECFPNSSQTLAAAGLRFGVASSLLSQLADEDGKNAFCGSNLTELDSDSAKSSTSVTSVTNKSASPTSAISVISNENAEWDLSYFWKVGEERLQNFLHVQFSRANMPFSEKGLAEISKQLLNCTSNVTIPLADIALVVRKGKMRIVWAEDKANPKNGGQPNRQTLRNRKSQQKLQGQKNPPQSREQNGKSRKVQQKNRLTETTKPAKAA